ncbi:mitogen-activated kinase kinase kinase 5-like isoform X2 [Olea europaea subsp. europaea]|uniref:mitogen-activated protein kinase kinase kinase n=1 Tax=Olea europaea subsp. europaea TaxID=158383 RepID=A0A8S0RGB3_OLEEU|nr:mitogen-activated kinase kinase kinase 5-like isoform X2 [Olea europaea subsp. europaea]
MHWWQGAFTPSPKSHSDDNIIGRGMGLYTLKTGMRSSRKSRQLTRARKLRHLTDNDVELWRTPTHCDNLPSQPCPQPLPLPESQELLRHDVKLNGSSTNSYNLPSPHDAHNNVGRRGGGGGDRNIEREKSEALNTCVIDGSNWLNRFDGQDARMNAEHIEIRSSGKSPWAQKESERSLNNYNINIPISAPTSPYSSPVPSPPRGGSDFLAAHYMTPPSIFQAWSALEVPHSDANLGLGFSNQIPPEKNASSDDNSPIHSPRASSHRRLTNATRPVSWHECNSQATVHPLPLPPGAALPSQATPMSPKPSRTEFPGSPLPSQPPHILPLAPKSDFPGATMHSKPTPIYPVPVKPELMPIKGQWQKGKLIGRGTFGSVYVASNRETGALCAMKEVEILPDDPKSAECMRQLEQEIKVLSNLKHPNIVQYYGSEIVGDRFYIYLEFVHPGSINKFIRDHCGAITESVVRNFTRHILCGLAYLHSTKTIHRDIKGANLLVDAYGVVKLADFGMAKHLTGQAANLSLKGSPYWMAPELLQSVMQTDDSSDLALAVDIWSLGCTIIEMMNGKPPWSEHEGPAALFKVLKETPSIPETMSADGKDFLHRCFRRNPADRPTASMLLKHPFVNQSVNEIKSTDDITLQQRSYKFDQVPVSTDTRTTKSKLQAVNFMRDSFSPVRLANEVTLKYPI